MFTVLGEIKGSSVTCRGDALHELAQRDERAGRNNETVTLTGRV